ncbi:hypothetical protein V2E24_02670 [Mycoplasmopsis ciconiae]|uniref:Lipoprotein n=1 Tax=Mycoplasmopsis ciconiae TaxID=561067 RepID=A0ABU7MLR1_9BACT|nr:hypothetical protein [Mycoplasmopsis ciconiae]
MKKILKNKFIILTSTLAAASVFAFSAVSCAQKEENNKPNPTPETPAPNPGSETSTTTPTNEGSTTNPGNETSTPTPTNEGSTTSTTTTTPETTTSTPQEQLSELDQKAKELNGIVTITNKELLLKAIKEKKNFWYDRFTGNIIYSEGETPSWKEGTDKDNVILSASSVKELGNGYQLANSENPTYIKEGQKFKNISTKLSYEVKGDKLILTYKLAKYIKGSNPEISNLSASTELTVEGLN